LIVKWGKKLKRAKKYANIITNLQYLQFMKEVAGQVFETAALSCDISEIRKKSISETRENKNFGKKCLTQGLR